MTMTIELVNGRGVTLVDDEDFEMLSRFRWRLSSGYAIGRPDRRLPISLHRFLMAPPKGLVVDHVNHDTLDNRRSNLRICTMAQNAANRRPAPSKSVTGFFGVRRDKYGYAVFISHTYLGLFDDAVAAAKAYDKAAQEKFGEFATLNFPERRTA